MRPMRGQRQTNKRWGIMLFSHTLVSVNVSSSTSLSLLTDITQSSAESSANLDDRSEWLVDSRLVSRGRELSGMSVAPVFLYSALSCNTNSYLSQNI